MNMGSWLCEHGHAGQGHADRQRRTDRGAKLQLGWGKQARFSASGWALRTESSSIFQVPVRQTKQEPERQARSPFVISKGVSVVPSMPSCPLEVCSWGGDGTAPSPAERLPATAGDGLCVINLQANPPAVAARQIKELTHLCLKPAAKGSWEESRVGVGERARERACVLLIDKKGRASSSERSRAPSKCRRRRRGKKKKVSFSLQEHAEIQLLSTEEVVTAVGARSAPDRGGRRGHRWL